MGLLATSLTASTGIITAQAETAEETPIEKSFDREKSVVVSKTEIPRSKYTITAKVDKNNELPKNNERDSSWVFHTNQVHIEMNDLKGLHAGNTITFFKNGYSGGWNGTVKDSNGVVVGSIKTEEIARSIRQAQYANGDLSADDVKPEHMTEMFRTTITFNKEIEKEVRKNLTIDLEARSYIGFEQADNLRTTYTTIRDSENKILDSSKLYARPTTMKDNTNPFSAKDINRSVFTKHTTALHNGTWVNRMNAGVFTISTGQATLYKKGTKFKFTKNPDSDLQYSFKDAIWQWTDHESNNKKIMDVKDATLLWSVGTPDGYEDSPTVNHRYAKDGTPFKVHVTEITDDTLEFELLEDMPRLTSEFKVIWYIPDNKVTGDINQYLDKDGNYNKKLYSPYKVSVINDRGWKGEYTPSTFIETFWSSAQGAGTFKPIYETVVDATHNGKVIKQNVGKSPTLRPAGTDISINVEKSIQVDGLWYKPTTPTLTLKQEGRATRKQVEYILDEEKNLAKVNVTIKHIGTDGKVLKSDTKTKVLEKTDYTSAPEKFPGYKLKSEPPVKQGKVGKKDIELIYTYTPLAKVNVTTKHVDARTGQVLKSSTQNNLEEETTYTTQPENITDYELVSTPENAKGTVGQSNITVEYRYKYTRTASVKQRFVNTKGVRLQDDVITEKQIPGTKLSLKYPEKLIYNGEQYLLKTSPNSDVILRDGEMVLTYIYDVDPATVNPHSQTKPNDPTDGEHIKKLEDEIKKLQDELKKTGGNNNDLQNRIKQLEDELKKSGSNNGDLQNKIKQLEDELRKSNTNNNDLQNKLKQLEAELKKSGGNTELINKLQNEIKKLQDELNKAKQGNDDLAKLQDEIKRLHDELNKAKTNGGDTTALQNEIKRLQDELAKIKSTPKDDTTIKNLEDEIVRLRKQLKDMVDGEKPNTVTKDQLNKVSEQLENTLKDYEKLQKDFASLKAHDAEVLKQLQDELDKLKQPKEDSKPKEEPKVEQPKEEPKAKENPKVEQPKEEPKAKDEPKEQSKAEESKADKSTGKKLPETGDPVSLASLGLASLIGARKLRRKK